jgi:hypothetical protein
MWKRALFIASLVGCSSGPVKRAPGASGSPLPSGAADDRLLGALRRWHRG